MQYSAIRSCWFLILVHCLTSAVAAQQPARLEIDATDLPRRLLTASLVVPLPADQAPSDGEWRCWYPKWVQGSHAPGGPIQNLAGLEFLDPSGNPLNWRRAPGEVYQFIVSVPSGTASITVKMRYICNQSSANSHGLDSFGSESLGIISPNTVLVYPDGADHSRWLVATSLRIPAGWKVATALRPLPGPEAKDHEWEFDAVTLEHLIDSPIMAGRHLTTYELNEPEVSAPPHRLHVFSEVPGQTRIHDEVLARMRRLVTQAARLFGSHPFPSFDILVATTNVLPRNGLEHLRSSLNVIPLDTLDQPDHWKGWDRMLIPHEYVHAWCGKYRRPTGMIKSDTHSPNDTELLWVYEGLTQHLGEILEVRAGLTSEEEYQWQLLQRLRWARLQQGRQWRPLADTGAASHTLRAGSPSWGHLRRDQDYYFEGALFWLEVDAIVRRQSDGARSLDDFCRAFFQADSPTDIPVGYSRDDVVAALLAVAPFDWDGWIRRRIDRPMERGPLSVAEEVGFLVQFANEAPHGPDHATIDVLDARDSVGVTLRGDGSVETVLLSTPADGAGLAPDMKIIGINGFVWSRQRWSDALAGTPVRGQIRLLVAANDRLVRRTIQYDGGPRYFTLVRNGSKPAVLSKILASRAD